MKQQTLWIGLAITGWIAFGWTVYRAKHIEIPGAGRRFGAIQIHTNGVDCTAIYRGRGGENLWAEWKFNNSDKPDTTTFIFDRKNIATVYTTQGKAPGFDFTFFGADGKPKTLWMARSGSETWTDRISYGPGEPILELMVNGNWELTMERDHKRGILVNGNWTRVGYTNGVWTILDPSQSSSEEKRQSALYGL